MEILEPGRKFMPYLDHGTLSIKLHIAIVLKYTVASTEITFQVNMKPDSNLAKIISFTRITFRTRYALTQTRPKTQQEKKRIFLNTVIEK